MWNCTHFPHPTDKTVTTYRFFEQRIFFFELVVTRILHKETPPLWNLISEVHSTGLILLEPSLDVTHFSIERFHITSRRPNNPVGVELLSYVRGFFVPIYWLRFCPRE